MKKFNYPKAKKVDVVDDYHGTKIADPYRWMENPENEDLKKWIDAENELTFRFLRENTYFSQIKEEIKRNWNYPRYSVPFKKGGKYFFFKNDGLQNHSVLYKQNSLNDEPKVLIDPNNWNKEGTSALENLSFSEDGKLLAYGRGEAGSDWQKIRIMEVETGKEFEEVLNWCKFSSIAWKHDNSGFYYNRFPAEGEVAPEDRNNYNKVFWHKLGTPQSQDILIYEDKTDKELGFYPFITEDGKYLVLHIGKGTDPRNNIYYRKVEDENGEFIKLLDKMDANYDFIFNEGSTFYFSTDKDAPNKRIIAIDIQNPDENNWKELIPETADPIQRTDFINHHFLLEYSHNVHSQLKIFDTNGNYIKDIELPTLGTVGGISGKWNEPEMFFSFTSFLYPSTIFRFDFNTGKTDVFKKPEIKIDAENYVTKQIFYQSKDGTKIPMFLVHKKDLELNEDNPVILNAYGGFNVSEVPYFSVTNLFWLQKGGIFALANLRGGGEFGEKWHQAGMLENKQNVFDDFISAAEWLIENHYTNSEKLAIRGGSNGGLLVAACMVQRPELFGAVLCHVPVIDMLRYHKFTVGRYWVPEYGNAEKNPEHFKFMIKYSPLHNIRKGTCYPPTLIFTADTDDRVVPAHADKFAATLQENDCGKNPILIRIEKKAGHGHGKPITKILDEISDEYSFLFKIFQMKF